MVDCARLESGYTLTGIEGSNPSLSARIIKITPLGLFLLYVLARKKGREPLGVRMAEDSEKVSVYRRFRAPQDE